MFYSIEITRYEEIMDGIKELVAEGRKISYLHSENAGKDADDTWVGSMESALVTMGVTLDALQGE